MCSLSSDHLHDVPHGQVLLAGARVLAAEEGARHEVTWTYEPLLWTSLRSAEGVSQQTQVPASCPGSPARALYVRSSARSPQRLL